MKGNACKLSLRTGAVLALVATVPANAQFYKQTNLVSDIAGLAQLQDLQLVNPWGASHSATSPFWVSNAGKSVSTLYSVNPTTGVVTKSSLIVNVPGPQDRCLMGLEAILPSLRVPRADRRASSLPD